MAEEKHKKSDSRVSGFVQGVAVGLTLFVFTQIWTQNQSVQKIREAVFEIKAEVVQDNEILKSANEEIQSSKGLARPTKSVLFGNLSSQAFQRNFVLLAGEDDLSVQSILKYHSQIAVLRTTEDRLQLQNERMQQNVEDVGKRIDQLVDHRDFLIVNEEKLTRYPNLLPETQRVVKQMSRIHQELEKNRAMAQTSWDNLLKGNIELAILRSKLALTAIDVIVASSQARQRRIDSRLWTLLFILVTIALSPVIIRVFRRTTKGQVES